MTPDSALDLLERMLADAWFDPRRPSPALAWEVFKEWARRGVDSEVDELSVAIGYSEDEALAYVEFCRTFDDPRPEWARDVFLTFSAPRPDAPRLAPVLERSADSETLAEFFARVAEMPGFRMALTYPYWEFEFTWE